MQKRRFNFAFDLENEKHAKAYEILSNYPNRHRGEFVIQAILDYSDNERLKELVYDAVQQALVGLDVKVESVPSHQKYVEKDVSSLDEIPDEAFSFLTSL